MEQQKRLSWSDAFGLSYVLLAAVTVAVLLGWSITGFLWPLIGPAAQSFLHDHPDVPLCAWVVMGLPAGLLAFCTDRPSPVLQAICIGVIVMGSLGLAAGAAATCDGPFLWLGGGAGRGQRRHRQAGQPRMDGRLGDIAVAPRGGTAIPLHPRTPSSRPASRGPLLVWRPVMDADPAAAPATLGPGLWAACEERAVVRLTLASGQTLTGNYTSRVGLHFLHRTGRDLSLIGEMTGPYGPGDVLDVEVVRTRAQVLADVYVRLHGERVPGREPRTRDEHEQHEQHLQLLAGAVVAASDA